MDACSAVNLCCCEFMSAMTMLHPEAQHPLPSYGSCILFCALLRRSLSFGENKKKMSYLETRTQMLPILNTDASHEIFLKRIFE